METHTVKVTAKGQISIPRDVQELLGIEKGDKLVMLTENDTITMQKASDAFDDLRAHSAKVAEKLWSNKDDDIWDEI